MILSRSFNNYDVLGMVNGVLGLGGIIGGVIVSVKKINLDSKKMIYYSAAISFLLGDLFMAVGRSCPVWCFAALAASIPMPFIGAGQNVILYSTVPSEIQGRVFAVRNALQYCTIPMGILLSGYLADYVFEPFMKNNSGAAWNASSISWKWAGKRHGCNVLMYKHSRFYSKHHRIQHYEKRIKVTSRLFYRSKD